MAKKRRKRRSARREERGGTPSGPVTDELKEKIHTWAEEAADVHEFRLYDTEVSPTWQIHVFVDRPGTDEKGKGVNVDECARISRYVEAYLDSDDEVPEKYVLEVSSPGLERALKKPRHVALSLGRDARVVLHEPIEGQNVFVGRLASFEDDVVELKPDDGDESVKIAWDNVARAKLIYEF